jgi:predicted nucleic acid-binding protein
MNANQPMPLEFQREAGRWQERARKERRLAAPRVQFAACAYPRRLNHVVGRIGIAEAPEGEAEQAREVPIEERVERLFVAPVSALMRTLPEPSVVAWLDRQPAESIWITSITVFEARFGLGLLPQGRRRRALEAAFARLIEEDLENRVLDFDVAAANSAASLAAERRGAGRSADMRDTQIAGIVMARRATLATRNRRHFADLKVPVVDPWEP